MATSLYASRTSPPKHYFLATTASPNLSLHTPPPNGVLMAQYLLAPLPTALRSKFLAHPYPDTPTLALHSRLMVAPLTRSPFTYFLIHLLTPLPRLTYSRLTQRLLLCANPIPTFPPNIPTALASSPLLPLTLKPLLHADQPVPPLAPRPTILRALTSLFA